MENLIASWMLPEPEEGRLPMALPASRPLLQIALSDIAPFVALVLENREMLLGRRVDMASDGLAGEAVAEVLTRVTGCEIQYVELAPEVARQAMGEGAGVRVVRPGRYGADIATLRRDDPEVGWHTFEQRTGEQDWSVLG